MIKRSLWVALFLWLSMTHLYAGVIVVNENVVGEKAVQKIEMLGSELKEKTGISVYLVAINSLGEKNMIEYENEIIKTLQEPFALLTLSKDDKQVDIMSSSKIEAFFDKEGILSPYPWTGTIIPLLTSKKGTDNHTAALLNGYADIVEQIAEHHNITLDNAIGSANKETLNIVRIIAYALMGWVFCIVIYRNMKVKYAKK